MTKTAKIAMVLAAVIWLGACAVVKYGPAPPLESGARWVLLPVLNHTQTPQAGLRAEAITEALLRSAGIIELRHYPASLTGETLFEPSERKLRDQALSWAQDQDARYALTGTVDEWRYKVGVDGEPAVGVSLELIDLDTNKTIWSAVGARTGWSREALSAVAQKLIDDLLQGLFKRP